MCVCVCVGVYKTSCNLSQYTNYTCIDNSIGNIGDYSIIILTDIGHLFFCNSMLGSVIIL